MPILNSHDLCVEESFTWYERRPLIQIVNGHGQFLQVTHQQARVLANSLKLYLEGGLTNESQDYGVCVVDADGNERMFNLPASG